MTGAPSVGIRPPLAAFEQGTGPLRAFVEQADAAGLDHLCVGDHVSFRDGYGYDGLVQATALAVLSPLRGAHRGVPAPVAQPGDRGARRSRRWRSSRPVGWCSGSDWAATIRTSSRSAAWTPAPAGAA